MKVQDLRIGDIVTVKGHDFPMKVVGLFGARTYSYGHALRTTQVTYGKRTWPTWSWLGNIKNG